MKQLLYLIFILATALMLACVDAYATELEDMILENEAQNALVYWGERPQTLPFKVQMVEDIDHWAECVYVTINGVFVPKGIFIKRSSWAIMSRLDKTVVMVHELGHCLKGIVNHSSDVDNVMYYKVVHDVPTKVKMLHKMLKESNK